MAHSGDSCCCCKVAAVGLIALVTFLAYRFLCKRKRKSPMKEDYKKDVVYLYQFRRVKFIPNLSPFCLKLETWLRMADITYENVECGVSTRSSEGTLPFIELNGKEHPDSSLAIRDLAKIYGKESLESHLDAEQRATALAFEKLAEASLFFVILHFRVAEHYEELFSQFPESVFGVFRPVMKLFVKQFMTCKVGKMVKATGIGKHSREEMIHIGTEDIRAISSYLGGKKFLFGSKPTRVDATLFGMIAQIVYAPYDLEIKEFLLKDCPNLKDYCERMKERFWPDWEECTTKFTLNTEFKKNQ